MKNILARTPLMAMALVATVAYAAASFNYGLKPVQLGPDTWYVEGSTSDFSYENGGNIVNTAFVVTDEGVMVVDSGPSRQYGEQLKAAIKRITDKPIVVVFNTHHHPDHFLGNQAFDVKTVEALPETIALIRQDGKTFNENMYRLAGDAMAGTEVTPPGTEAHAGILKLGAHEFELLSLSGHTPRDLAIYDRTTGTLFGGDLIFHQRAPTTPNAILSEWNASLDTLAKLNAKLVVPGHGPASPSDAPIRQTRAWLQWLETTLRQSAQQGLDMNEVLAKPIPEDLAQLSLAKSEFTRSVSHLYPAMELEVLNQ
ncbi:quinoprotein relay system zinc metallohydrolase 1 [Nitrogeniibacter aestuarii]|uniref:quinoprotein relay system zinc metallohydrolase 1 n=1 Tax=Nitrogeniibacter aestuarii TaxID=2815343 RepID=UPI001D12D39B|nr:quinoprotein relay system zinc metallohydrolase 1 [Nitrogeniibacter aestuarii]